MAKGVLGTWTSYSIDLLVARTSLHGFDGTEWSAELDHVHLSLRRALPADAEPRAEPNQHLWPRTEETPAHKPTRRDREVRRGNSTSGSWCGSWELPSLAVWIGATKLGSDHAETVALDSERIREHCIR